MKSCEYCGKEMLKEPRWTYEYFNRKKYCSEKCFYDACRTQAVCTCEICKKEFNKKLCDIRIGRGKYCSLDCRNIGLSTKFNGENNSKWNGGITVDKKGYNRMMVFGLEQKGLSKYRLQHIVVVERYIGRQLNNSEVVHHIDGIKKNNDPSNLYLFQTGGDHTAYHSALRRGEVGSLVSNLDEYKLQEAI